VFPLSSLRPRREFWFFSPSLIRIQNARPRVAKRKFFHPPPLHAIPFACSRALVEAFLACLPPDRRSSRAGLPSLTYPLVDLSSTARGRVSRQSYSLFLSRSFRHRRCFLECAGDPRSPLFSVPRLISPLLRINMDLTTFSQVDISPPPPPISDS